jgi:hypothetical protein
MFWDDNTVATEKVLLQSLAYALNRSFIEYIYESPWDQLRT